MTKLIMPSLPGPAGNVRRRHQTKEHPNLLGLLVDGFDPFDQASPVKLFGGFRYRVLLNVSLLLDVPRADAVVACALNLKYREMKSMCSNEMRLTHQ
jgi:hypothetical protein